MTGRVRGIASQSLWRWSVLCCVAIGAAAAEAAVPQTADEGPPSRESEQRQPSDSGRPFSPLHDFLGIDPQSGEFVDPSSRSRREPAETEGETAASDRGAADATLPVAEQAGEPQAGERRQPAGADPIREAEAASEAVRRLAERINEGSLEDLSSIVGERFAPNRLSGLSRQLAWLTAGLLALYPLSIGLAELFAAWFRRHDPELTDLDHRYRRTRLFRRLLLSGCWIVLIILGTIASLNGYWWAQPRAFTLFCVLVGVLGIAIAALTSMIKESAKHYSLTLMRQMRREQLEIRADLDELCKRMRQVTMTRD